MSHELFRERLARCREPDEQAQYDSCNNAGCSDPARQPPRPDRDMCWLRKNLHLQGTEYQLIHTQDFVSVMRACRAAFGVKQHLRRLRARICSYHAPKLQTVHCEDSWSAAPDMCRRKRCLARKRRVSTAERLSSMWLAISSVEYPNSTCSISGSRYAGS